MHVLLSPPQVPQRMRIDRKQFNITSSERKPSVGRLRILTDLVFKSIIEEWDKIQTRRYIKVNSMTAGYKVISKTAG